MITSRFKALGRFTKKLNCFHNEEALERDFPRRPTAQLCPSLHEPSILLSEPISLVTIMVVFLGSRKKKPPANSGYVDRFSGFAHVIVARSEDEVFNTLRCHHIDGILVTGQAITQSSHSRITARVIDYANRGGTLVFGDWDSHFYLGINVFPRYFESELHLPWTFEYHLNADLRLNTSLIDTRFFDMGLPRTYTSFGATVRGPPLESFIYVTDSYPDRSPVVFTGFGRGYVGWLGERPLTSNGVKILKVMFGLRT